MTPAQRTAAEQALECLESLQGGCTDSDDGTVEALTVWCPEVIDALRAALAEPMRCPTDGGLCGAGGYCREPQRQPLTDAQIEDCIDTANRQFNGRRQGPCGQQMTPYDDWKYWLVRAAERAHGIGEAP